MSARTEPPARPISIAVIGAGEADAATARAAEAVGRALGAAGAVLVCGGLGGVMEAACRGARAEGGMTVGILPGRQRSAANPYVTIAVATGLGEARNALVVVNADAVIAIGGGFGTLSEIGLALKGDTPVIGLQTWGIRRPGAEGESDVTEADGPAEAVELALRLAESARD